MFQYDYWYYINLINENLDDELYKPSVCWVSAVFALVGPGLDLLPVQVKPINVEHVLPLWNDEKTQKLKDMTEATSVLIQLCWLFQPAIT